MLSSLPSSGFYPKMRTIFSINRIKSEPKSRGMHVTSRHKLGEKSRYIQEVKNVCVCLLTCLTILLCCSPALHDALFIDFSTEEHEV